MSEDLPDRAAILARILVAARSDPRIVGVLDYGSSGEGRGDAFSDLDICLFIRDDAREPFEREWRPWVAQFARPLLAYMGGFGHPWVVYAAAPRPLRADFALQPESNADIILSLPNAPRAAAEMLPYESDGGGLLSRVERLVGQDLGPPDLARAVEATIGDFWYYLLRCHDKLSRGHAWAARQEYGWVVLGNLIGMLRLEGGATARWRNGISAAGIEADLPADRLALLDACVAGPGPSGLRAGALAAIALGRQVSAALADRHGQPWPAELADRLEALYQAG